MYSGFAKTFFQNAADVSKQVRRGKFQSTQEVEEKLWVEPQDYRDAQALGIDPFKTHKRVMAQAKIVAHDRYSVYANLAYLEKYLGTEVFRK